MINTQTENFETDVRESEMEKLKLPSTRREFDELGILQSFWELSKLTVPLIGSSVLHTLTLTVTLCFIGHQNDAELLAGVATGLMLINLLCYSITWGLNGPIDTLV